MSFSAMVKEELTGLAEGSPCCQRSELAGVVLASGSMRLTRAGVQVEITTESPGIARRVFKLIKAVYSAQPEIEQHERHRLNRNFNYRVALRDSAIAQQMLQELGILGTDGVDVGIKPDLMRRSCCENALLRGLFLGCGSMSDPGKGYHLELVTTDESLARNVAALLAGSEINARVMERKGKAVVYVKEADHISRFLVLIGAHTQMLKLENIRVEKGVRNTVNRVVNCDTANVEKTVRAANRQLDSIRAIARLAGLDGLPSVLREVAEARLNNPDATLERIAALLGGVSKSGLNHRFQRLEKIATELRRKEGMGDEP